MLTRVEIHVWKEQAGRDEGTKKGWWSSSEQTGDAHPEDEIGSIEALREIRPEQAQDSVDGNADFVMKSILELWCVPESCEARVGDPGSTVTSIDRKPDRAPHECIQAEPFEGDGTKVMFPGESEDVFAFVGVRDERTECAGVVPSVETDVEDGKSLPGEVPARV